MVPILLASVGEIITEKNGVVNIGLEGIFIISSFAATVVAYYTNDPLLALFIGMLVGSLSGLLHGVISAYLNGDQIIAGVGFNSFAYGLALMIMVALWQSY
ncbi:MAG: ABC transporter permease, partial [Crenarchaeota archaeon]|nr:ABC transporter permease [Thermoproteota archaeon]